MNQRPFAVTLIASFQFLKAGLFLFAAAVLFQYPNQHWGSTAIRQFIFVVTNGHGFPGLLTPILGIYFLIVGVALWRLKKWARDVLLASSGLMALRIVIYVLMEEATNPYKYLGDSPSPGLLQAFYMLAFVDGMVFLLLAFYPGMSETFGEWKRWWT